MDAKPKPLSQIISEVEEIEAFANPKNSALFIDSVRRLLEQVDQYTGKIAQNVKSRLLYLANVMAVS